jgi:hypothetical protein
VFETIGVLLKGDSGSNLAGRQGVSELLFRRLPGSSAVSLTLSATTIPAQKRCSVGYFRLLTFSDFSNAMALEMALAES